MNDDNNNQKPAELGIIGMVIAVAILFGLFRLWCAIAGV